MGFINLFEYRVDFYFPKTKEALEILEDCPFIWKGKVKKKHFVRKGDIVKYSFNIALPGDTKEDGAYNKALEYSMTIIFNGMSNKLKSLDIRRSNKIGYELIRVGLKKTIRWDENKDKEEGNNEETERSKENKENV